MPEIDIVPIVHLEVNADGLIVSVQPTGEYGLRVRCGRCNQTTWADGRFCEFCGGRRD